MAFENRVDDARASIAVLEGRKCCWASGMPRAAAGNVRIDVVYDVAERIAPRFLMSAWQMRIPLRRRYEQRWIFQQDTIRAVPAPQPELVLPLLVPAQ